MPRSVNTAIFITEGNEYHVSPHGRDSGVGDSSDPFKTLNFAVTRLVPGDTLWLRRGIYREHLLNMIPSGTIGAPIAIRAYGGEPVAIQAINSSALLTFSDRSYITLDRIRFDGDDIASNLVTFGFDNFCSNIKFLHCEMRKSAGVAVTGLGINLIFRNIELHDWGTSDDSVDGYPGFLIAGHNLLIEDCTIHDARNGSGIANWFDTDGNVHIKGQTIRRNSISYCQRNGTGTAAMKHDAAGIMTGIDGTGSNTADLINNLIYLCDIGIVAKDNALDSRILFNTIYGSVGVTYGYGIFTYPSTEGLEIENNIVRSNAAGSIQDLGSNDVSNNLTSNPEFVDVDSGDFHLQSGSPARSAGVAITDITTDKDLVDRQDPPDIGAYQFV